jgi:hypothetical protein
MGPLRPICRQRSHHRRRGECSDDPGELRVDQSNRSGRRVPLDQPTPRCGDSFRKALRFKWPNEARRTDSQKKKKFWSAAFVPLVGLSRAQPIGESLYRVPYAALARTPRVRAAHNARCFPAVDLSESNSIFGKTHRAYRMKTSIEIRSEKP